MLSVSGKVSMPIYTYRCENCGVQFDRQQHFDDPQLKKCPECGKLKLRKVFLPVGIVFKGSGFYATDHSFTRGWFIQVLKGAGKGERVEQFHEHSEQGRRLAT
jgi:putative FmdB family regulatory protein